MATKYFRITAYFPAENLSVIIDSNGMFEKLWEFSSLLVQTGLKVLDVSNDEKFIDVNISKAEAVSDKLILRAYAKGKIETTVYEHNGVNYKAIQVGDKIYIPDKDKKTNK